MKQTHAYIYYGSTCSNEISNYFNAEIQPKDTESTINNELVDLLAQLKGFKFVASLVLELKKKKMKKSIAHFIQPNMLKQLLVGVKLMICLIPSISWLYQTSKNVLVKGLVGFWIGDSIIDHTINIWKYNTLSGSSYIKLQE